VAKEIIACHKHTRVVENKTRVGGDPVVKAKLSRLEYQIMDALWARGELRDFSRRLQCHGKLRVEIKIIPITRRP
jgi:hypothetical protein